VVADFNEVKAVLVSLSN